jgi:hypothetical protein
MMDFELWILDWRSSSALRDSGVTRWQILDLAGSSQRLTSFIKDAEVGVINENAVAALTGEFAGDADGNKVLHGFTGCWEAHLVLAAEVAESQDGAFAQRGKDAQNVGGGASTLCCAAGVRVEEIHEPAGCLNSAVAVMM